MIYEYPEYRKPTNNTQNVLVSMMIGGLVGAVAMLSLAPRSGKETRKQIQEKGIELRDRTTEMMDDTVVKVRTKATKIPMGLKDRGQEVVVEQLENVSDAAQAGKKAIRSS